jgi:hypothetical protein
MTSSTIAQRQKDALAALDFDARCWWFIESDRTPAESLTHAASTSRECWLPVLGPTCTVMLRHLSVYLVRRVRIALRSRSSRLASDVQADLSTAFAEPLGDGKDDLGAVVLLFARMLVNGCRRT